MITHTILKYKPPVYVQPTRTYLPQQQPPGYLNPQMGKLEYAQFLKGLKVKAGDWIVHETAKAPYTIWQVYKCIYIEEIHHNVKNWGSHSSGPWCGLYRGWETTNFAPDGRGQARSFSPRHYKTVDHADVPDQLKLMYADADNHQVPPTC